MRRRDDRRWGMPSDLAGAALAFFFELIIVVGLAFAAFLVAAVVTAMI